MSALRNRIGAGHVAAVLLCLAAPVALDACFPRTTGERFEVVLQRAHAEDAAALPADVPTAARIGGGGDGDIEWLRFRVSAPRAGRYTLRGLTSQYGAHPVTLTVNGRPVTAVAFYANTGSWTDDFAWSGLGRGVALRAGANVVDLRGEALARRSFALGFDREAPLGLGRHALYSIALLLAFSLRAFARTHLRPSPRARLAFGLAFYVALVVAPLVVAAAGSGPALATLGVRAPGKTRRLAQLEDYLRSDTHAATRDATYTIAILGDSTQHWGLPGPLEMLPTLRRTVPDALRDEISVYGVAAPAMNAYDFYLLANRLAEESPDLLIVPVNLRSFHPFWLHDPGRRHHPLERYVLVSELPHAFTLSVAGRRFGFARWLLYQVDDALFDGRAAPFLRGLKVYYEREETRLANAWGRAAQPGRTPIPEAVVLARLPRQPVWGAPVPPDHELLGAFRRISRLAARHGTEVLYYAVQAHEQALRAKGIEIHIRENYATIGRALASEPGSFFLDLSAENPAWMFSDEQDHLTPKGVETVARRLMESALARRAARTADADAER